MVLAVQILCSTRKIPVILEVGSSEDQCPIKPVLQTMFYPCAEYKSKAPLYSIGGALFLWISCSNQIH